MDIRIGNISKGPHGKVLAFFDVILEDTFILKGFALKMKTDGTKYYYQAPSKKRLDKEGKAVQKDGYDVWDAHVDMYGEEVDGKYAPTEAAWAARAQIIELAVAAYEASKAPAGRGAATPPKAKTKAATAPAATTTEDGEDPEDDDLPF